MTNKLYEFTATTSRYLPIGDLWSLARAAAEEQADWEVASGGEKWSDWELLLMQIEKQAEVDIYHFEVREK